MPSPACGACPPLEHVIFGSSFAMSQSIRVHTVAIPCPIQAAEVRICTIPPPRIRGTALYPEDLRPPRCLIRSDSARGWERKSSSPRPDSPPSPCSVGNLPVGQDLSRRIALRRESPRGSFRRFCNLVKLHSVAKQLWVTRIPGSPGDDVVRINRQPFDVDIR